MTIITIIRATANMAGAAVTVMCVDHAKGPTQKISVKGELLATHLQLEVNETGSSKLDLY